MRIKKDFLLCFLPVIAVLFFVFLSPAFAQFKKVNECELALTNASRTGQLVTIPGSNLAGLESKCIAVEALYSSTMIPDEEEPAVDDGSFFSVHDDYGYNWLQNLKAVGDPYYEDPPPYSPVTIESGRYGDTTWIRIGLGSQEVSLNPMDINVTLGSKAESSTGQDQILGTIHLDGLTVKTNGSSYVTMYKSDSQLGIGTDVDVTIDRISLATLSWGDNDGCHHGDAGNTGKAGYVGIKDTTINNVTASGSVSISVGRVENDLKSVHMALGNGVDNLNVGIGSLDTTVVLGDKKDFSGTRYTLGTLYMKDLKMNAGGYLDIYNPSGNGEATTLGFGLNVPWLTLDTLAWGDSDGVGGTTTAGYVGLKNLAIDTLTIAGKATVETLTVQVGDISSLPDGTVFVRMGLSNLDIGIGSLNTNVALGNGKDNLNQVLGSVYLSGLEMNINGNVDIHTPSVSTQGIVLDVDVNFSKFKLDALSWGDADGVGGTTTAGYVGLKNLAIVGLKVKGPISIEVATVDPNVIPTTPSEILYNTYETHNMSPTFVHIGIGTGDPTSAMTDDRTLVLGMTSLATDVVVDHTAALTSPNAGVIGNFYCAGVSIAMNGWIHIGAH